MIIEYYSGFIGGTKLIGTWLKSVFEFKILKKTTSTYTIDRTAVVAHGKETQRKKAGWTVSI